MIDFWERVDKNGPIPAYRPDLGPCWIWTGPKNPGGYGTPYFQGKMRRAHRVAYELILGTIPAGKQLDHLCRVRHCVNPAHLEPVTNKENALRGFSFSAKNAKKTHCINGHEFSGQNLRIDPSGRNWLANRSLGR